MKKIISTMLAVVMLASVFAIGASATIVPSTYTQIEGAYPELVYVNQDFQDIESNSVLTTNTPINNSLYGNITVADGVLNFIGAQGEKPTSVAGILTADLDISNKNTKITFDMRRNHEMTDEMALYVVVRRDENTTVVPLSRYGAVIPIQHLEKDVWYEYELTFHEDKALATYEAENAKYAEALAKYEEELAKYEADPENNVKPTEPKKTSTYENYITTAKMKKKGDATWTTLSHYGGNILPDGKKFRSAATVSTMNTNENLEIYVKSYNGVKTEGYTNSDINVSFDNVVFHTPASAGTEVTYDYPILNGNVLVTKTEEFTTPVYEGKNVTPAVKYTAQPTAKGSLVATFEARTDAQAAPLYVHFSGFEKTISLEIIPADEIIGKWYTYKIYFKETDGLGVNKIYRKESGSDASYEVFNAAFTGNGLPAEERPLAVVAGWWNGHDITSAKFWVNGALSGGVGDIRFGWHAGETNKYATTKNISAETLAASKWTIRNVQVISGDVALSGMPTVEDGVLTTTLTLNTAKNTAAPALAVYDANNRLVDADMKFVTDGEGNVELSANYPEGSTAKLFVWENVNLPYAFEPIDITALIQ